MDRRPDFRALIVFAALAGLRRARGRRRRLVGARRRGRRCVTLGARARDHRVGHRAAHAARRDRPGAAEPARRGRARRARVGASPDPRSAGPRASSGAPTLARSRRRWPPTSARSTWSSCGARSSRGAPATCSSCSRPYNSSNYPQESLSLVPQDPRTSHASVWMYLERIPLRGARARARAAERLRRARDARRPRADDRAADRLRRLARRPRRARRCRSRRPARRAARKVVVTFVIDGGGWNVLDACPDDWPNLTRAHGRGRELPQRDRRVVPRGDGVRARDDRHRHVPEPHGITGHNIRDEQGVVRKAYDAPGQGAARRHLAPDALRPLARADRRVGRRDRLPGLAPRHDGLRRPGPPGRRPAGRRLLGRGRHRDLAAAQPGPVPASGVDAVARGPTSATSTSSTTRAGTPSSRPSDASRRAAARRSCATRAT